MCFPKYDTNTVLTSDQIRVMNILYDIYQLEWKLSNLNYEISLQDISGTVKLSNASRPRSDKTLVGHNRLVENLLPVLQIELDQQRIDIRSKITELENKLSNYVVERVSTK